MTAAAALPESVRTGADAAAIEALARRAETPSGDGTMVWHVWGEGRPVVLLHGGSGSWSHWVRNIAALVAAGRSVYVPDLPGFGDSAAPPAGHDADALPQWVEAGLGALIGPAGCDVVGFSFGAMVAAFLAARFPSRIQRLVLVGAPALDDAPVRPLGAAGVAASARGRASWSRSIAVPAVCTRTPSRSMQCHRSRSTSATSLRFPPRSLRNTARSMSH